LLFFKDGKPIKFGGSRNLESMKFWLNKRTLPPLIPIDSDQLDDLETNGEVNIVFYGNKDSPKADIVAKISTEDDFNSNFSDI
jgi:protein disulfide-isomerase A1